MDKRQRERLVEAYTREGEAYRNAGMSDRLNQVNNELVRLSADIVEPFKDTEPAVRQKRTSTQAAARKKRTKS